MATSDELEQQSEDTHNAAEAVKVAEDKENEAAEAREKAAGEEQNLNG